MTRDESFKKRVRARMQKTGERYSAARAALLAARPPAGRAWVSDPETSDAAVAQGTGRGWNAWCDLIDAWGGEHREHKAIAEWLRKVHGVDLWWSQTVTVGYERITGRRLPGQMADGTFTAGKSKTVPLDADALRDLLQDERARRDLFPDHATTLRSRPGSKAIRIGIGPGVAVISATPAARGTKVVVQHEKLPEADEVPRWKFFWTEWLEALADA